MLGRIGKLLLVGLLLMPALGSAQQAERPLSEGDLVTLVNAKTPEDQLIAQVRARGLSFKPSAELEAGLKKLGLTKLIAAMKEPASVEVHANVPGAGLTLDGEKRDPLSAEGRATLAGLEPGEHTVGVQADGYVDASFDLFLKPGEAHQLEAVLREAVTLTPGPLGSRVGVQAGTPADSALAQLEFSLDLPARIEILKRLVHDFDKSPLAIEGYRMLQETYLSANQYDSALAAGEELLRRDPRNFTARVRQVQAYLGKGELDPALQVAAQARQLIEEVKKAVPPMGGDPTAWQRERDQALEAAEPQWKNLAYTLYVAVAQLPEPAPKRAALEKFLEVFPQSDYVGSAYVLLALTSQQLNDAEAMLGWARKGLEANPDQGLLLVLVSDTLSERGQELEQARERATRLLQLLKNEPDKVRLAGASDEQWAQVSRLWEGTAHSVLGQVLMHEETAQVVAAMSKTRQAIEEFKVASPLLKADTQSYSRNLYRLGYAYAKLGMRPEARQALNEVMGLETPYRQVAGPLLEKLK